MDLDATPFRGFLAVARHGSFTRAAEELHLSQPALSATIRELERRLGFTLFDRTSRRVALTREGRSFLVNAERVVLEHDWATQRARELRRTDLRLAVPPYSTLIAARVVLTDGYMAAFPRVAVEVVQMGIGRIAEAVRRDDADIGIVLEPAVAGELSPGAALPPGPLAPAGPAFPGGEAIAAGLEAGLERRSFAARPLGLFLPPGHPLAGAGPVAEAALAGLAVAVTGRVHGAPVASAITRYLEERGATPVRVPEADAFSTLRHARHRGIAAVDLGWFEPPASEGDVTRRPIAGAPPATELRLLRRVGAPRASADHFWRHAFGEDTA